MLKMKMKNENENENEHEQFRFQGRHNPPHSSLVTQHSPRTSPPTRYVGGLRSLNSSLALNSPSSWTGRMHCTPKDDGQAGQRTHTCRPLMPPLCCWNDGRRGNKGVRRRNRSTIRLRRRNRPTIRLRRRNRPTIRLLRRNRSTIMESIARDD